MSAVYARNARFAVGVPPIRCTHATLRMFLLPVERSAVEALLQANLVQPSGGAVTARFVGRAIALVHAQIPAITSLSEPEVGSISEQEVAVWIPIARRVRGGPEYLSFFVPYMFVDSGAALSAGREGLGLPKELASIEQVGARLEVAAETVQRGGSTTERATLLSIEPTRAPAGAHRLLSAEPLFRKLVSEDVTLTALRQIPDISDPTRAAFSEVVEIPVQDASFSRRRLVGSHAITISDTALHPLRTDLVCTPPFLGARA